MELGRWDPRGQAPAGGSFPLGEALEFLRRRIPDAPEIYLVLGSGLGALAEGVADPVAIPFSEIPGFPEPGVEGHGGRLVAGFLEGRRVLVQAGRFHLYEGYPGELIAAPVRLAAELGASVAILTNAAGGIDPSLRPGSILLLDDHLNLTFRNPLWGPALPGEARFPDASALYDPQLQALAGAVALDLGIPLERGAYAALLGPSYETPAEIRLLGRLGVHAVGMSTVPEVLVAVARRLKVLAFSLITNAAAGLGDGLSHDEVLRVGRAAGGRLSALIGGILRRLPPKG